jgi:hypothetical protein
MSIPKKIFFISTLLLIATLLLWGAYYLSFKKPEDNLSKISEVIEKQKNNILETVSKATGEKISLVVDEPVLSPAYLDEERAIKYFRKDTGRGYEVDADGKDRKTFSTKEIKNLAYIVWSPDRTRAISKVAP